jgi:lipid-binding SYLF domain-containing protein
MYRTAFLALGLTALLAAPAVAFSPAPSRTLRDAADVLDNFAALPDACIPPYLMAEAQGVAIIPGVVKAGFLVGGRGGHGLIATRDRNGAWSGVTFVELGGVSLGLQAGVESADVVLVFKTRNSLDRIIDGRGKLTLGADAAIAAGPVGRQAEADTDARLRAEIVSYSRSRGLFVGVALDGAALIYDRRANAEYLRDQRPEVVQLTTDVLNRLVRLSTPAAHLPVVTIRPPVAVPTPVIAPPAATPTPAAPVPPAPVPAVPPAPAALPRPVPPANP